MSKSPLQSPLGVNVLGTLIQNTGLNINQTVTSYIGTSTNIPTYTYGSILNNTLLNKISTAKNLAYNLLNNDITDNTYRSLLSIGSGNSLALSNSTPATYTRVINVTATSSTNNTIVCDSTENLELNECISLSGPTFGNLLTNTVYYVKTIESTTEFTVSLTSGGITVVQVNATGAMTLTNLGLQRYGFIRQLALQAYQEFNINNGLPSYENFLNSFLFAKTYIEQTNPLIITLGKSTTYLYGSYSNMSDLISSDITGVNLATSIFGQELIRLGKSLNLKYINKFGLPSNLLKTLNSSNAITRSLNISLIASGIDLLSISKINNYSYTPTKEEERKIFDSFGLIIGKDLTDILTILNCKTVGIESLQDLLNPKKLFPESYSSLTVPVYNTSFLQTNSKTYYPIYSNGAVNNSISSFNLGTYLEGILPSDYWTPCYAFSFSMQQIPNISNIPIEKFAQVVLNIETTKDLNINATAVPVNTTLSNAAFTAIAKGSGIYNTYTTADFFGCMSGTPYNYKTIESLINSIDTTNLEQTYDNMITLLSGVGPYDAALSILIAQANTDIVNLVTSYPAVITELNSVFDSYGTQLTIEQNCRFNNLLSVTDTLDVDITPNLQIAFVNTMSDFAIDTNPHMYAQTLESISDTTTDGGQSIIGLMREIRNKNRLDIVGIPIHNSIPSELTLEEKKTLISNGNSNLYPNPNPYGYYDPTTKNYVINNPTFNGPSILDLGDATVPGSLASSPYKNLIPPNLNTIYSSKQLYSSTYSVSEALDEVTVLNCSCWNN
jgi:hypothetical protein